MTHVEEAISARCHNRILPIRHNERQQKHEMKTPTSRTSRPKRTTRRLVTKTDPGRAPTATLCEGSKVETTPTTSQTTTRLRPTLQISTNKKKADTTPTASFGEVPNDELENDLEPWVGRLHSASNSQGRRLDGRKWNHVVDLQTEQDIYWQQAGMIAKHHEGRWTTLISNWNRAMSTKQIGYRKQGRPARRWVDDINSHFQPTRTNRENNHFTNDWLTKALHEKRLREQQTETTCTTHDPIATTTTTRPTTFGQPTHQLTIKTANSAPAANHISFPSTGPDPLHFK